MKLIIWDYDGTLSDTHTLNFEATKAQAKACGIELPCSNIEELLQLASPDINQHYTNLGFRKEDYPKCEKIYKEFVTQHKAPIFHGIFDALEHFSHGNIQCVVTSNYREVVELSLSKLMPYFQFVVDYDYGGRHKPHPEPLQLAMELTGFEPHDVTAIGDMPQDIVASKAAGIGTIVAATWDLNNNRDQELSELNPDKIFSRTEQLLTI